MPSIVIDRVTWFVGLSVGLSPSETCKNGCSDRDAVYVEDSSGSEETPTTCSGPLQSEYCIVFIQHNTAI